MIGRVTRIGKPKPKRGRERPRDIREETLQLVMALRATGTTPMLPEPAHVAALVQAAVRVGGIAG